MSLNSPPCFKKTSPAVCDGLIPIPSSVMMALVAGGTLNSSAAYLITAVKGVFSGIAKLMEWLEVMNRLDHTYTLKGSLGSDVSVILNWTLTADGVDAGAAGVAVTASAL